MQKRYDALDTEISVLETSIDELPEDMTIAMHELVIDGFSWEEVAANLYVSFTKFQKLRRAAIENYLADFLSLQQTNVAGSFFFVSYINLKIIVGFNILSSFFRFGLLQ